jgi:hypothetical protein
VVIVSAVLAFFLAVRQDDARLLTTGTLDARRDALARIMALPPAQWSPDLWHAVRQEVERVVTCLDVRSTPAEKQTAPCDVLPRSEDNYFGDLVQALSQGRDPAIIPTLIKVASSGAMAATALARFGDLAVSPLIESAMSSRSTRLTLRSRRRTPR